MRALLPALLPALLLVALCVPSRASADLKHFTSLEWLVASHDTIARGVVQGCRPAGRRGGACHLTLAIKGPQLKGSTGRRFTALYRGRPPAVGADVLVFTRGRWQASSCGRDPRTGKTHYSRVQVVERLLTGPRPSLPTRHFTRVVGFPGLVNQIRLEARRPKVWRSISLPVPQDAPINVERGVPSLAFHPASLAVPRDERTERYLHDLLRSERASDRVLAANLLVHYESRANIQRLRKLRRDTATLMVYGKAKRWVADAAEHTLRRWQVPPQRQPRSSRSSRR